ncbi:MAG TPA: hypothetical protein VFI47_23570 [Acidimicrobiales bacterium]|nr:hypothetical protein [Acidimicrobiales bacterium]
MAASDPGPTEAEVTVSSGGDPSEEEVAAIVAAVEVAWPRAVVADTATAPPRWRFSGRWWTKPIPLRRNRPW